MIWLLLQPWEFQTWDAVKHLTSVSPDDLGDKDEGDFSKCANDAEPGGVLSAEKQQDILKTLNDLGRGGTTRGIWISRSHMHAGTNKQGFLLSAKSSSIQND